MLDFFSSSSLSLSLSQSLFSFFLHQFVFDIWYARGFSFLCFYAPQLVDKFTYLGSSVASNEKDIDTRLTKAWTAINRQSIIWKSDLTDKMKRSFFQAVVASILLYGCTTWTLKKRLEKKLGGNYTRMLRASPGGNTPQDTNCTATCLLSRKLFKLDEPDMQDTAGEAGTKS